MPLDIGAIQQSVISDLPIRVRWMLKNTYAVFDFSPAKTALQVLAPTDVVGVEENWTKKWADYLIFGKSDYSEGGGGSTPLLAIDRNNGKIYELDVEQDEDAKVLTLLNSSMAQFIKTFRCLGKFLEKGEPLPKSIEGDLRVIDSEAYPTGNWRFLVDYLIGE